uniref:DUF3097 family protein n=1 Tax=Nocardia cyriacigeorgica TaxID=135487 RepID=UPI0024546B99
VLVTGHPFIDVWQAVRPAAGGIREMAQVARGEVRKTGVFPPHGAPNEPPRVVRAPFAFPDLTAESAPMPQFRSICHA